MQEETNEAIPALKGKKKADLKHRKKNDILLKSAIEDQLQMCFAFFMKMQMKDLIWREALKA